MIQNALFVIEPYQWNGIWVFDDPRVGLAQEPFVSGVPEIIEEAVREIPDAAHGFTLIFSASPFPGATIELNWVREEMGGNWYRWNEQEGWLCPALFRYFETAPPRLYVQVKAKPGRVTSSAYCVVRIA